MKNEHLKSLKEEWREGRQEGEGETEEAMKSIQRNEPVSSQYLKHYARRCSIPISFVLALLCFFLFWRYFHINFFISLVIAIFSFLLLGVLLGFGQFLILFLLGKLSTKKAKQFLSKNGGIIPIIFMIIGWFIWGYCDYSRYYYVVIIGFILFCIGCAIGIEYFIQRIRLRKLDIFWWIIGLMFTIILGSIIFMFLS